MTAGDRRLLARTLALRQARSIVARFERMTADMARNSALDHGERSLAASLHAQAKHVLNQIDEALK